ncbi:MAG TPA: transglycosylase SLT domain-containing protein [Casimicrobiaceae bacterium]|nr:transglycosylase SLT domain-containing protein [Casimicrobiaceae bacterium]
MPLLFRLLAAAGFALATGAIAAQEISLRSDVASSLVAQAVAYEHGEGVPRDPLRAAALYCEAARSGDAEAQFSLGWMYANGRGIARDDAVAASLFGLAAEQGHAAARKALHFIHDERGRLPDCILPDEPVVSEVPLEEVVDPFADLPPAKQKIADLVNMLAPAYTVAPRLALAVITVESNFDPNAQSQKDARGLMQLIPGTATRFRVKNAFDVRDNVRGGLAYLRWLLSYYRGDVALAAAAYNAGEGVVDRYRGVPPYPETRSYVQRVLALFGNELHPYDPKLVAPAPFVIPR